MMLNPLTKEQQAVVESDIDSHSKIIAVAGAGKTTTLISRINHLIEQGVQPDRIAVFMFNKSAQEEFSQRLALSAERTSALKPDVMTFHSFGMKLARRMEQRQLIERAQLVTDDFSLVKLLREAMQQLVRLNVSIELHDEKDWLEDAILFLDQVKSSTQSAKAVFHDVKLSKERAFFPALYKQFEALRQRKKIRFFSDLISDPLAFIQAANEEQTALYQGLVPKYSHLLIDEFQDINDSQYALLKKLYQDSSYWMMVGDVEQCIYEWRGAKPDIMQNQIDEDFKPITRFDLSTSFRFGHQIGLMATNLLAYNIRKEASQPASSLQPCVIGKGQETEFAFAQYDKTGKALLSELKLWGNRVGTLSNAAVLVRLYSDMVPIQLALMHRKVPYQLHGDSPLFENRQIRMLMAYIAVMAGGFDDASLFYDRDDISYLMTVPSLGIPPNQRKTINQRAIASPHLIPQMLESMADEAGGWRAKKLLERADWLRSLTLYKKQPDKGIINTLEKLGIYRYFENTSSKDIQYNEKVATCESFIAYIAGVQLDAPSLLNELKQLAIQDKQKEQDKNLDGLHLMSLHKAKGLEFDLVIMAGLKEGQFPYYEANKMDTRLIEAERRLFYVGITRAKQRLVLLNKPDKKELKRLTLAEKAVNTKKASDLSRFIFESQPILSQKVLTRHIEGHTDTLEVKDAAQVKTYFSLAGLSLVQELNQVESQFSGRLKPGEKVRHDQFGQGVVIRQESDGHEMIFVEFEGVGYKRFNPKHTKLVKVSSNR
ncbi:UvrD/REP helicase [Marinomonas sp. SBI22]|uniref:ATP-dependent helicase n=1 Tax=unclassified Marinomonas TaxID=196814 RepID=UPI0007AFE1E9|nr:MULTISPECIES: ATP-dependent helicase [unclassified Marinomonas]KZM45174.1 UvrD/REP helicase [Marinomonas sp. SBI22]KZM46872.1 UvrD/REP helicase [Marinomonas sp. SBI8L]